MQQAPLSPGIGSLDRLDSLHEYFMLTSPPASPPLTTSRAITQIQNQPTPAQEDLSKSPLDVCGYYHGSGSNLIAPQENVMQSTSVISVDRSNALGRNGSLGFGRIMPNTQRDIDEMLKMDGKDMSVMNLTELFLKSSHRASLNNIYQAAGALKGHDRDLHHNLSNSRTSTLLEDEEQTLGSKNATAIESDGVGRQNGTTTNAKTGEGSGDSDNSNAGTSLNFDIDVEPTPLHEIKAKSEMRRLQREQATRQRSPQQETQQQQQDGLTPQKVNQLQYQDRQNRRQHSSNYYPFGRAYQLPIPTMPPVSPPQSATTTGPPLSASDAVATAAALASVQDEKTGKMRPNCSQTSDPARETPSPSLPLQPCSHQTWPPIDRTAVHSNASRPESTSPPTSGAHPQHQHFPNLQQSHPQPHHPSYPVAPHHLATPLAVGTIPHAVPPKVVGPYTTAQRGNSNTNRRRTDSATNTTFGITRAGEPPAPPSSYLPRRGNHTRREASAAHTQPKGVHDEAAKARRGHIGFHKPATSQTTSSYHHPLPQKYPSYDPATKISLYGVRLPAQYTSKMAVPPPPIAKKPRQTRAKTAQDKSSVHEVQHHQHWAAAPAPAPAAVPVNNPPADTAYERKKQRAKDARVKLNESIERLHVSMGVAGLENKKRTEQLRNFMKNAGRENENHTDHQAFELMDSCVKTAESAKKWDRPNFVGSAATMISCLNSQCEILMKELMEYQQAKSPLKLPGNPEQPSQEMEYAAIAADLHPASLNPSHREPQNPDEQQLKAQQQQDLKNGKRPHVDQAEDPAEKRRRCVTAHPEEEKKEAGAPNGSSIEAKAVSRDTTITSMTICAPLGHPPVHLDDSLVGLIASYLDPTSLVRSARVCKDWRRKRRGFQKDETWTFLCLKRFGHLNTRKWQEQQSDKDDGAAEHRRLKGMALYRTMSSAKVMPSFQANCRNQHLIGQGFLQNGGGASAWLFLVERSNGETMRSVLKRHPSLDCSSRNSGVYASLPVVELRILIQNIGVKPSPSGKDTTIVINKQVLSIDASTRRRGEEMFEIDWDDKFAKKLLNLDGTSFDGGIQVGSDEGLARLGTFDSVVLVAYIHARRCSTSCKFLQKSNFLRLLLSSRGTTQALVIPIGNKKAGF